MTLLQACILGIIQGLTEYLPISSSAHLVLIPHFLHWQIPAEQIFPFDILVQMGTLLAVIVYFYKDLWEMIKAILQGLRQREQILENPKVRLAWYLIIATIPAGLAGLLIKDFVESIFHDAQATSLFLFGTAAMLWIAERYGRQTRNLESMNWKNALWVGIGQAVAIFPGISRSGSTITIGMVADLKRTDAARFSFLMSIPVMLAAGLLGVLDLLKIPNLIAFLPSMLVGFVCAAIVGYLSIYWLLSFLGKRPLTVFSIYCVILGILGLVLI